MSDQLELTKRVIILQTMEIESGRLLVGHNIHPDDTNGGYTNDPYDNGGETNWGWTAKTLKSLGISTPVRNLTFQMAYGLYGTYQWDKMGGDSIYLVHRYLARVVFNYAVHAGVKTAVKRLQMILNLHNNQGKLWPDIKEDGYWGKRTLAALMRYLDKRNQLAGKDIIFMDYLIAAGAHYQTLAKTHDRYERYYYGWMRRIHEDMANYYKEDER